MPPATAASNRRAAPVLRAAASSSGPWWAMTCLFAVTTGLPAPSAAAMRVRAGSSPPMSSTMTSVSGSATRWAGRVGQQLGRDTGRARPGQIADRDPDDRDAPAVGGEEPVRIGHARSRTAPPTVPAPSMATRSGGRLIGARGRQGAGIAREW